MPETMTLKCLVYSFFWRLLVIGALFRIATLSIGQIEEVSIPERDDALMLSRMKYLKEQARKTILVHVHIPKAGGSAMALALSTNCQCDTEIGFRTPDAPYCSRCAQVRGRRGAHLDYSISRATGWKFGVHSPFAVLHWILTESKYTLKSRGLVPVYIIMLRNPFERFLSECKLWTHKDLRAVDWSLTRRNRKTGELLYHPSVKYLHGHRTAERASNITEKDYLMEYASLPQTFIIQNRQTKMIGGTVYDFDMRFNSSKMMGSRWKPRTVRDPDYNMNIFLGKAVKVLSEKKDVILGLQERFAETICTLEIVYGHLYRFDWQSNAHSHNADKSFNLTTIAMASKINTEKYEDVYKAWALNNREDEQLFLVAEKLFDMQFRTAVSVLKLRLENANEATRATLMERTPHCQTLLDQNYNFVFSSKCTYLLTGYYSLVHDLAMVSLADVLAKHSNLVLQPSNKILCTVTNHEMPAQLDAVQSYLNGKKYKKYLEWYKYDYSEFLPYIVEHRNNSKQLFCTLTGLSLNKIPTEVKKHVQGKRFIRLRAEMEAKLAEKSTATTKRSKAGSRDDKGDDSDTEFWKPPATLLENSDDDSASNNVHNDDDAQIRSNKGKKKKQRVNTQHLYSVEDDYSEEEEEEEEEEVEKGDKNTNKRGAKENTNTRKRAKFSDDIDDLLGKTVERVRSKELHSGDGSGSRRGEKRTSRKETTQ